MLGAGNFGLGLPLVGNILLFGGAHSGPSSGVPVTGTFCLVRYGAAPYPVMLIMPSAKTFFCSTSVCAADRAPDVVPWSSPSTTLIFRPSTPPSAFCWSIRASNPVGTVVKPAAVGPVSEVSNPRLIELAVTPGALLLLALPLPVAPALLPVVEEPLLEQAAANNGTSTMAPASAAVRRLNLLTCTISPRSLG